MLLQNTILTSAFFVATTFIGNAAAADTQLTFTTLAGKSGALIKSTEGTGSDAQFWAPRGIAIDSAGTIYVADSNNHTIRKITASKVVTTLAGMPGTSGVASANPAKFHEPFSVAVDTAGTIYVADTNNGAIRKITSAGVTTTLAGGNGAGYADGTGSAAKFKEPRGIAVHSGGNIYVADYENNVVRKVTSAGVVTTLAGTFDTPGTTDGLGAAARFMSLNGIAVDSAENVYVADAGSRAIRKITPAGLVTTFAGGPTSGQFGEPRGIAIDAIGNVYVTDYSAHVIYKVSPAGVATKVAGTAPTPGSSDGTTAALFNGPSGIAIDNANNLYVADTINNTIRKISSVGTVETFAGLAGRTSSVDGQGSAARFEEPYAVATDGGYVYVADSTDHSIRKISADGLVTTLAGQAGSFGSAEGSGNAARFNAPRGIAAASDGTVYVADTGNATVRKISSAGVVTTLAGTAGLKGSLDATGAAARFSSPFGVSVDSSGNVFVVDSEASTVRKITSAGVVTTIAGSANSNGFTNGTGTAARFFVLYDITLDSAGNLYVIDRNNHAVRKITPAGVVTTLAGAGSSGYVDGNGTAAKFNFPSGLTTDSAGNVYVADTDNQVIRKITPTGDVTTIAGGQIGYLDAVGTSAKFTNPKDVAMDSSGNLFVADKGNYLIRKGAQDSITVPGIPTNITAAAGDASATISFTAPSNSGGAVITGYIVTASPGGAIATGTTSPITVVGLANGTSYTFTVTATNTAGTSTPSGVSASVTPSAALLSAPTATLVFSGSAFLLDVPYLEFTNGNIKEAYSAQFSSVSLVSFTLVPGSVKAVTVIGSATSVPVFTLTSSGFKLTMPYLEYVNGSTRTGYSANLVSSDLSSFSVEPGSVTTVTATPTVSAPTLISATAISLKTVGTYSFGSSSKLAIAWTATNTSNIDHYEISAIESVTSTSSTVSAAASATTATLTPLRAATNYSITIRACANATCTNAATSNSIAATTPEEYWQLQGTASGNTVSSLTKPVADGNARLSATQFGAGAGTTANTVQFYYGPQGVTGQSVASSGVVSASNAASYLSGFTSYATTSGVRSPSSVVSGIKQIMTGQGVPLSAAMGGKVRLFFESNDADLKTRIYSVDSVDGYIGRDFNSGSATTCSTSADYLPGGSCPATVVIGVAGDTVNPTNKITAARQNKIAWPTLTDWRWNGEVGTFMVFTIDRITDCTTASHNHGYAQWNGSKFEPQYDATTGCPKAFKSAQAALPMHIGGVRYKMYFGDPTVTTGKPAGDGLPFVGPKKLIYGDGTISGSATSVEFEDWESVTAARNVNFLWPNGELLNDKSEGYIDDFHFLTPTGSLDIQVLYLSITDGTVSPFAATAVLLNP